MTLHADTVKRMWYGYVITTMKKYILISCAALLSAVSIVSAQNYAFTGSLYLGSTGSEVAQLQTWLIGNGFDIPAIVSGETGKGYFGIQTQNALEAYQQSVGLSANGFFGPDTIARINGTYQAPSAAYPVSVAAPVTPVQIAAPVSSPTYPNYMTYNNSTVVNPISNPVQGSALPIVSGLDAPTTLAIGQIGTWDVHASDPLNTTLSYSVSWGDATCNNAYYPCTVTPTSPQAFSSQNSIFTHAYVNSGTYTPVFTVTDTLGLSTHINSTVNVGLNGVVSQPSGSSGQFRVVSPNGGEVWQAGTVQYITWTSQSYPSFGGTVSIKLQPYQQPCVSGQACPQYLLAPYLIASNLPANQDTYGWTVGNAENYSSLQNASPVPSGRYTVQVCQTSTSVCDSSDGTFTIVSGNLYAPTTQYYAPTTQCPAGYTCTPTYTSSNYASGYTPVNSSVYTNYTNQYSSTPTYQY